MFGSPERFVDGARIAVIPRRGDEQFLSLKRWHQNCEQKNEPEFHGRTRLLKLFWGGEDQGSVNRKRMQGGEEGSRVLE